MGRFFWHVCKKSLYWHKCVKCLHTKCCVNISPLFFFAHCKNKHCSHGYLSSLLRVKCKPLLRFPTILFRYYSLSVFKVVTPRQIKEDWLMKTGCQGKQLRSAMLTISLNWKDFDFEKCYQRNWNKCEDFFWLKFIWNFCNSFQKFQFTKPITTWSNFLL